MWAFTPKISCSTRTAGARAAAGRSTKRSISVSVSTGIEVQVMRHGYQETAAAGTARLASRADSRPRRDAGSAPRLRSARARRGEGGAELGAGRGEIERAGGGGDVGRDPVRERGDDV